MILWVDFDNDGDSDLFLSTKNGKLSLYQNNGIFAFTDITAVSGLSVFDAANFGASWGDYNRDGFLDLYVCRYRGFGDVNNLEHVNVLYRNNGDGTFTNVTSIAGVGNGINPSYQSVWFDYNNDSWQDLLVVNDRYGFPNALYHNNGDGTFQDVAAIMGIDEDRNNFMSGTVGDFDNDKDLDIYMSNTATLSLGLFDFPHLFQNQDLTSFVNNAPSFGLELNKTSWGGLWLDYDNNGWQDLYVATSNLDINLPIASNYLYSNQFPSAFSIANNLFEGNHFASSHAVARGDINNDGFYDIVAHNEAPNNAFLWQNFGNNNNYIKISLEGSISNKMAIGSWIHVYTQGNCFSQYTFCGENYLGQNSQHHIFGLGNADMVDSVHVIYLSGIEDKYYDLDVNNSYHFIEASTLGFFTIEHQGKNHLCYGDTLILQAPHFESYLWSNGTTLPYLEVFEAGLYSVQSYDSFGLFYNSNIINIEVLNEAEINVTIENERCFDSNDGAIYLEVNTNIQYDISWSSGAFGDSLTNLNAGTYTYVYLDDSLCSFSESVELQEPFPLNVQYLLSIATIDSFTSLELVINGGSSPFTIVLNNDTMLGAIDSLVPGYYNISVYDSWSCSWTENFEVMYLANGILSSLTEKSQTKFKIYPQPFSDLTRLEFTADKAEDYKLQLFNSFGALILSKTYRSAIGNNKYDLKLDKTYSSGIYLLSISTAELKSNHTLMVK
jgi:hypothetical protein